MKKLELELNDRIHSMLSEMVAYQNEVLTKCYENDDERPEDIKEWTMNDLLRSLIAEEYERTSDKMAGAAV